MSGFDAHALEDKKQDGVKDMGKFAKAAGCELSSVGSIYEAMDFLRRVQVLLLFISGSLLHASNHRPLSCSSHKRRANNINGTVHVYRACTLQAEWEHLRADCDKRE